MNLTIFEPLRQRTEIILTALGVPAEHQKSILEEHFQAKKNIPRHAFYEGMEKPPHPIYISTYDEEGKEGVIIFACGEEDGVDKEGKTQYQGHIQIVIEAPSFSIRFFNIRGEGTYSLPCEGEDLQRLAYHLTQGTYTPQERIIIGCLLKAQREGRI